MKMQICLAGAFVSFLLSAQVAKAGVVAELDRLVNPKSPGGNAVTDAELARFQAASGRYTAEEAILGLVYHETIENLYREHVESAPDAVSVLLQALRNRVQGLAASDEQLPGLSLHRLNPSTISVVWEAAARSYRSVSLFYTLDDWTSAQEAFLSSKKGLYEGQIAIPSGRKGILQYALKLVLKDGRTLWLNNPRESSGMVGGYHYDYRYQLAALDQAASVPAQPAFELLLETFVHPQSPGGAAVVMDEFSLLVEQLTWEGGYGLYNYDRLAALGRKLYDLQSQGVVFLEGTYDGMMNFFESARRSSIWASYPAAGFERDPQGEVQLVFWESRVQQMELVYSADGWNTPWIAPCQARQGAWVCSLGALPFGVPLAYRPHFIYEDGRDSWPGVEGGHNFFQIIR